jgi:O-antigen/teichoic acid export membrane protein
VKSQAWSLTHQTLHTYSTIMFSFAAQFAAGIAVARAFGPAGKGQVSYAALMIPFAICVADGIRGAIMRQAGVEKRPPDIVYGTALAILFIQACAGTLVFICLWRLWPQSPAYLFVALSFPFVAFVQMAGAFYSLTDTLARINLTNALTMGGGASLVTIAAIVFFNADVYSVLTIGTLGTMAAAFFAWQGLRETVRGHARLGDRALFAAIAMFGAKGSLGSIADFLSVRLTVIIVAAVLSPAALGIYSLAVATAELTWQASKAVTWASTGRMANLAHADACSLTARLVRLVLSTQAVVGLTLFAVGPWLITHVYGARFADAGLLLRIVIPGVVLYSVDGIYSTFIAVRANRPGLLLAFQLVALAFTGVATAIGVFRYGMIGAAVASSVAYVLAFIVKSVYVARHARLGFPDLFVPRISDLPAPLRLRFEAKAR